MKKVVTVIEVEGEGFEALLDKQVLVYCLSFIYTGRLVGVNKTFLKLDEASIVYDTGAASARTFTTSEKLSQSLYIQISSVESFSETEKK